MARERRSLQDLIRGRQQRSFAGRQEQVAQYQGNLGLPVEDERRRFLFNIHGNAGVGKTYLSKQLWQVAIEQGALAAYTDEAVDDVTSAMTAIAAGLDPGGAWLGDFGQRAAARREPRDQLEPGPGASGAARAYLARKFGDHADVRLLPSAAEELTPAFVAGLNRLAAAQPLALFFDTYERTSALLDQWLRDLYAGCYGDLPATLVTTISGRSPLDPKLWGEYLPVIADVPLEPFSEAAARQFLASKGISDEAALQAVLTRSGRLPIWLATLAGARPKGADDIGDPADGAVGQLLGREDDPARRSIAMAAALPRSFSEDILAAIAPGEAAPSKSAPSKSAPSDQAAGELLSWLTGLEFVTSRAGSWRYHEVVRTAMLERQRAEALSEWRAKHAALARAHGRLADDAAGGIAKDWDNPGWIDHTCEKTYHLLCANPINNLPQALALAVKAAEHSPVRARQWAWLFADAGRDIDHPVLREWGQRLVDGINDSDLTQYLTCLITDAQLKKPVLAIALEERGEGYRRADRNAEALADFSRAIELNPKRVQAIASRGETYRDMERYDDALADFSRALELDPGSVRVIISRAETYHLMKQYGDALADFNHAVQLDPGSVWAIINRGETHHLVKQYDDALADFNRATELNPGSSSVIALRGEIYGLVERYDDALADFSRAIELDPSYAWAIACRAETYQLMERYDDALADVDRAIQLDPESSSAIALRGEIYREIKRHDDALADLNRAIELDPSYAWAIGSRGQTYREMGRHDDALADLNRAIELDPSLADTFGAYLADPPAGSTDAPPSPGRPARSPEPPAA